MNLVLSLLLLGDDGVGSVRLLSGHLLLFYLIPLMYFRVRGAAAARRRRPAASLTP